MKTITKACENKYFTSLWRNHQHSSVKVNQMFSCVSDRVYIIIIEEDRQRVAGYLIKLRLYVIYSCLVKEEIEILGYYRRRNWNFRIL